MPRKGQPDKKRRTDLVGEKYGKLTALEYFVREDCGKLIGWLRCQCECGRETEIRASSWGKTRSCRCLCGPRRTDLVGQRFGRLTVLGRAGRTSYGQARWLCRCDCGNEHTVLHSGLKNGSTKSCGCLQRDLKLEPEEAGRRSLYAQYKHSAKKKGIPFELEYTQFIEIATAKCFYCDAEPSRIHKAGHNRGECVANGIDRVANNGDGYVAGNVVPCCWFCNRTKRETPYQDFVEWIARVYASLVEKGEIECA